MAYGLEHYGLSTKRCAKSLTIEELIAGGNNAAVHLSLLEV